MVVKEPNCVNVFNDWSFVFVDCQTMKDWKQKLSQHLKAQVFFFLNKIKAKKYQVE